MYCVSVAYPNQNGGTFDFDYYVSKHVPMVNELLGGNLIRFEVRRGVASPDGSAASFVCLANFWIHSTDQFEAMIAQHGERIMGDVANYTDIDPILQVDQIIA